MSASTIPVTGWYLENRTGNHSKFYTVLIAETGVVVTAWGRIGTAGQNKIQAFPALNSAEALGKRQMYSKQTGGYSLITDDFKFTVDADTLNTACQRDDASLLLRAFAAARSNPQYEGDRDVVLQHYDDFAAKAQRLLSTAGERNFEEVFTEFEELKGAWAALQDKHDEVAASVSLAEQILGQRLMSGAL